MQLDSKTLHDHAVARPEQDGLKRVRVLIPTSRDVYRSVSYGMIVDFEDAVASASDADLVPVPLWSRRDRAKAMLRGRLDRAVPPPRSRYDICLLVAMSPDWLPGLRYIQDLRKSCGRVVVYLYDSWLDELPRLTRNWGSAPGGGVPCGRIWPLVDDLFVSFEHTLGAYSHELPCRVHYLPQAIDKRWFHPYRTVRPIDVLSVGRRLPQAHRQLLALSRERDLFYHYQTHVAPQAIDLLENQELLGRLCQSARVHVDWSVDRTNPNRTSEGAAITARWFESAACGAAVIGSAPRTDEFSRLFPYPGFVRELDGRSSSSTEGTLDAALAEANDDDRRELAEYVRTVHTWEVRWRQIVEACGI